MKKRPRIAILGSRGIPANYGGFETIAEGLATGLVQRGFEVFVACEGNTISRKSWNGINLIYFPILSKFRPFSEVLFDVISLIWASLFADVIYLLAYPASFFCFVPLLLKKKIYINPDGLEWKRRKFGPVLRKILYNMEVLAVCFSSKLFVDSKNIGYYFKERYGVDSVYIPNGIPYYEFDYSKKHYNLERNSYYLIVARLEPENNIDFIINEFINSNSKKKMVVVGPLNKTKFVDSLLSISDNRLFFLGGVYDKKKLYWLRDHCFAYLHGHEVGGTNPSLVEALSCGSLIVSVDVPFNREVAENHAYYFSLNESDLSELLLKIELENDDYIMNKKTQARKLYFNKYTVENMVNEFIKNI